jgi:hypothetical protein
MGQVYFLDFDQIIEADFIQEKNYEKPEPIPLPKENEKSFFDSLEETKESEFENKETVIQNLSLRKT